ncbi:transmembrane prolyl 4-hydroxylase-like isoform X2 [Oculina patagonica]
MFKVSLKQASPMWVRVSFAVVVLSIALGSWFIRNRGTETLLKEGVIEDNENRPYRLPRIDPIEVGYVREIKIVAGKVHKMRTLSLRPTLFEIEDFLTEQECDDIIFMAQTQGLERSMTLGEQIPVGEEGSANKTAERLVPQDPAETFQQLDTNFDGELDVGEVARGLMELGRVLLDEADAKKMMKDLNMDRNQDGVITYNEFIKLSTEKKMKDIVHYLEKVHKTKPNKRTRDSSTAFLDPYEHIDFKPLFESLADRIHLVTKLPRDMIWSSENMQVIRYNEKQHYHCHYDSEDEEAKETPCCHHAENLVEVDEYEDDNIKCVPCRYLTFFYYLKEPKMGGETAFPLADSESTPSNNDTLFDGDINKCDLSDHCYDANLYYKPKRGAALFWYNHHVSEKTGWLGALDVLSYHGGCDVIKGVKWAANNWINAGVNREKDLKLWEESRLMEEDFLERMRRHPWEEQTREKDGDGDSWLCARAQVSPRKGAQDEDIKFKTSPV